MNFKYSIQIVFIALSISAGNSFCQVYNYAPIIHNDIETNPAILASENMNDRVQFMQQNTFSEKNPFSYTSLRFSKYFKSCFSGVGLSINNTCMENNSNYKHIGIAAAYRNILFNKVFIKFGACYKFIYSNLSMGEFNDYSFYAPNYTSDPIIKSNMNLALSFSSASDRYYVSLGRLNCSLPWHKWGSADSLIFPNYYVINAGNFINLFSKNRNGAKEISYSAFFKGYGEKTFSQYINIKLNLALTRRSGLQYGIRAGYAENAYFHFIPFLTFYKKKIAASLSYSYRLNKKTFYTKPYSTTQINIIYLI
jgi:hypothetical protein